MSYATYIYMHMMHKHGVLHLSFKNSACQTVRYYYNSNTTFGYCHLVTRRTKLIITS